MIKEGALLFGSFIDKKNNTVAFGAIVRAFVDETGDIARCQGNASEPPDSLSAPTSPYRRDSV